LRSSARPCLAQVGFRTAHRLGKHLAQIEHRVAEFLADARAVDVDFSGAPEGFQPQFEFPFAALAFAVGECGVLALLEDIVEFAVEFAHRIAFGFGGVGGEHGFHAHVTQDFKYGVFIQAHFGHLAQFVGPESFFRSGTLFVFAQPPDVSGDAFLDEIEELEGDGIRLAECAVRTVGGGQRLATPWQPLREVPEAEIIKHIRESFHGKGKFLIQQAEALVGQWFGSGSCGIFGHGDGLGERGADLLHPQARSHGGSLLEELTLGIGWRGWLGRL